jgi:hypothetical protein
MIEFYIDIRVVLVLVFAHGPSSLGPKRVQGYSSITPIYHHGINYQYLKFSLTLGIR